MAPTCFAGGTLPSLDTFFFTISVAPVVPKLVVPRPAEFGACGVIVMGITLYPYPVCELCLWTPVVEGVPLCTRIDNPGVGRLFYYVVSGCRVKRKLDSSMNSLCCS